MSKKVFPLHGNLSFSHFPVGMKNESFVRMFDSQEYYILENLFLKPYTKGENVTFPWNIPKNNLTLLQPNSTQVYAWIGVGQILFWGFSHTSFNLNEINHCWQKK